MASEYHPFITIRNMGRAIALLILVVLPMVMISFCIYSPEMPDIHLTSLNVTNLNTSDATLAITWRANLLFKNPNLDSEVSFKYVKSYLFYKDSDFISTAMVEPFGLEMEERKTVSVELVATGFEGDQPIVEYPLLKEINKDNERGMVRFSMRLSIWAAYKTSWGWRKYIELSSNCADLNAGKMGSKDGTLMYLTPKKCSVFVVPTHDG